VLARIQGTFAIAAIAPTSLNGDAMTTQMADGDFLP
jgi:hypothetical protein